MLAEWRSALTAVNSNQTSDDTVHFSMLENGLDFISSGLRYIAEPKTKSDLKYAILHLSSGIELVLKERLAREDWKLLFTKPDKATEEAFKTGDFKGINFDVCLERLEEFKLVSVPAREFLLGFKKRRNRFEHFRVVESRIALETVSIKVLSAVLDFISDEFDQGDLSSAEEELLTDVRTRLASFEAFRQKRIVEIQPLLREWRDSSGQVIGCPCCSEEALRAEDHVVCAFCGYATAAEDAAELYIANMIGGSRYYYAKDGGVYPLHTCPNCDNKAFVFEEGYSETPAICFACGYSADMGDLDLCDQCGDPVRAESKFAGMCPGCYRDYYSADHR